MSLRFLTLFIWLSAVPLVTTAQEITNEDLMRQIQAIKSDLTDRVLANESAIAEMRQDMEELQNQFNQQVERQRQILDSISREDSSGRRIPQLSAIMQQSEEFRQDVAGAVHDSLRREGTLHLTNKTGQYRQIFVNRQQHGIEAGKTMTLKVPVGTVTTQLPGRNIENWTVAAPDYEERVDIVPLNTTSSSGVTTTYYPPNSQSTVTTTYYPTTTTYYPTTTAYYAPTTTYYPTTTAYYAPTTTYYASTAALPTTTYYPTTTLYYPTTSLYYSSWYYPTTTYYPTLLDWLFP